MAYTIRELRDSTHLTQKEFSYAYGIPLSTIRKWEQGESSPPPYVIALIARTLPSLDSSVRKVDTPSGVFYYDPNKKEVSDQLGNRISVQEDPEEISDNNLAIYLEDLFSEFYEIQEKFNRDCRYDKIEGIQWTR